MNQKTLKLVINGKLTTISIPSGFQKAHGTGLDGKTQVKSLETGESPEYPGKQFVRDIHGNGIMATPDELLVAARQAAPDYTITAVKK